MDTRQARPDPKVDQIVSKLLDWLGEASVIQVAPPVASAAEPVFYLELAGGEEIWFGLYRTCIDAERPYCPLVIGGSGRPNTQIVHPDLWRWLDGRAWQQQLRNASHPSASSGEWTGPLRLTEEELRARIEAEPAVVEAGLHVAMIFTHARYIERQEADGKWRIYESPAWKVSLRSSDEPGSAGRLRFMDDLTGEVLWEVFTTYSPTR